MCDHAFDSSFENFEKLAREHTAKMLSSFM
jgi:hypothetical protein